MLKVRHKYILIISVIALLNYSCEDPIDVDLEEGRSQLVVDAFLNSDTTEQKIRLTRSAEFFLNAPAPIVTNADVKVIGPNGIQYSFNSDNQGNFVYRPSTNGQLDSIGFNYRLLLTYDGQVYTATSKLNPVPKVDSMTFAFEEAELGADEGYYTQFHSTDFPDRKDYYWIKAFRNLGPLFPNNPEFLNLSEDGSFGSEFTDGEPFIFPIRAAITDFDEPFIPGEVSSVELWSLNQDVYSFLQQMSIQANNDGLFSIPAANIRSNILDANGQSQEEVLGVFSVSSVSRNSIQILP